MKRIDLCNYCGKEREYVQNEKRFKDHTCRNKNEVFCSICEKCFGSGLILRRHIESVQNAMVYKCNECEAFFTTMAAMKRHEKGHQKIKEQKCDICNKEFSRKEHLLKHRKSCSAKVIRNSKSKQVNQSKRTQAEDLMKCNECNNIFTKKINLK